jgi:hypothetical protein
LISNEPSYLTRLGGVSAKESVASQLDEFASLRDRLLWQRWNFVLFVLLVQEQALRLRDSLENLLLAETGGR